MNNNSIKLWGRITFGFMILVLIDLSLIAIKYFPTYTSFEISDWLINYQGGFVRRGLCGELLYRAYQVHPFNVRVFLYSLCILMSVLSAISVYFWFKKKGWSLFIVASGFFFLYILFRPYARRDLLMLALMIGVIYLYGRYLRNKHLKTLVTLEILSVLMVLVHESSFFFIFPILFFYDFSRRLESDTSVLPAFMKAFALFSPLFITMGMVSIYKGNEVVANDIWASWTDLFNRYSGGGGETCQLLVREKMPLRGNCSPL